MKKSLLMATAMMAVSMAGNAQLVNEAPKLVKCTPQIAAKSFTRSAAPVQSLSKTQKSMSDGVYYTRPVGTFFRSFGDHTWSYYYQTGVTLPPFINQTFVNQCNDKASALWYFGEQLIDAAQYPSMFDENNSLQLSYGAGVLAEGEDAAGLSAFYMPTIESGFTQYTLGEEKQDYDATQYPSLVLTSTEPISMGLFDGGVGFYATVQGSDYAFGRYSFDMDLDGDGTAESYKNTGVWTYYEKPASPLWIESIDALTVTMDADGKFFSGDGKLTLTIKDVYRDDNGRISVGAKTLATIVADANSVLPEPSTSGNYTFGTIQFKNEVTDEYGNVSVEPIVLDQEFILCIDGFQEAGVDLGFGICSTGDDQEVNYMSTFFTLQPEAGGENLYSPVRFPGAVATIGLNAMFDRADVMCEGYDQQGNKYEGLNILRVSADGQSSAIDQYPEMGGVQVQTARPWTINGEEQYSICEEDLDANPWIAGLTVDESAWISDNGNGLNYVTVTCEPLPAGTTYRQGVIHLQGRGFKSLPIIVAQGEGTVDGIEGVNADKANASTAAYNLNGQRVNANAKGIVIKDGKKFINK